MKKTPKIKICGNSDLQDTLLVASLKPDYLGFVVHVPKSPRNTTFEEVTLIVREVRKLHSGIRFVGVFVNQSLEEVSEIVKKCGLDIAQLHGEESPEYVEKLRKTCEVWKALIIYNLDEVKKIQLYQNVADKLLFDAGKGSGNEIDLSLLKDQRIDILAGGLGVENIERVIEKVQPEIVDANSKLESIPGKKDIEKVKQFINLVRNTKHNYENVF